MSAMIVAIVPPASRPSISRRRPHPTFHRYQCNLLKKLLAGEGTAGIHPRMNSIDRRRPLGQCSPSHLCLQVMDHHDSISNGRAIPDEIAKKSKRAIKSCFNSLGIYLRSPLHSISRATRSSKNPTDFARHLARRVRASSSYGFPPLRSSRPPVVLRRAGRGGRGEPRPTRRRTGRVRRAQAGAEGGAGAASGDRRGGRGGRGETTPARQAEDGAEDRAGAARGGQGRRVGGVGLAGGGRRRGVEEGAQNRAGAAGKKRNSGTYVSASVEGVN